MRNEIKAIIFIAIVSFLAFLPGLPVLATALDDMHATTTGNNVVNISGSFSITGTSTLVQNSSWTGKRDCTVSSGAYPNFKYNLAGALTSQGYTGINPAYTCDGVKYLFSSAAITSIIELATLSEGYFIATDYSGYPSHQPPDQAGFIILKWESGQLSIPVEYNWSHEWELDWPITDSWVYPLTKDQCLSYDASKTYGSSTWEFHKILQVNNPEDFSYLHIDLIKDGSVVGTTTWDLGFAKTLFCGGLDTCQLDLMSWKEWPALDITDGTYRLEFNLCNDIGETDCMDSEYQSVLWYVILGEALVNQSMVSCSAKIHPLPQYRVVYDSEDEDEWYDWLYRHTAGRVGDFLDKWYNSFKERFPFSWLFYFYETSVETINEYSDGTGTSTAVGFTVGWTMPTSSVVMAGQDFTVVDFEEASERWGSYFTIFRNIFIFVLYLGLVTTIFYQTKKFLLSLSEED